MKRFISITTALSLLILSCTDSTLAQSKPATINTREILTTTVIPEVLYDGASMLEVVRELDQAVAAKGISIRLQDGLEIPGDEIHLQLDHTSVLAILRYTTKLAQVSFRIDGPAVIITQVDDSASTPNSLEQASWTIDAHTFFAPIDPFTPDKLPDIITDPFGFDDDPFQTPYVEPPTTARDVLIQAGIFFPPGASAKLNKETHTLSVTQTTANIELIDALIISLISGRDKTILTRIDIFEVPMARMIDIIDQSEGDRDESAIVKSLTQAAPSDGVRLVSTSSIISMSGNRAKAETGPNYSYISKYKFDEGKDTPVYARTEGGSVFEIDTVLNSDNVTMSLNFSYHQALGDMEIQKQQLVSPVSQRTLRYEKVTLDRVSFTTQLTLMDGQTRFIGAANGKKPGTSLAAFVNAQVLISSR